MFISQFSGKGNLINQTFHPIELKCCDAFVDLIGFIATTDKRVHLLINFAYPGTGTGYPVLSIFDVQPTKIEKIGEFCGFYEHAIPEQLRDLNGDGNTEIIHVGQAYWPSGKAHADMEIINYEVAEYKNGKYLENNDDFHIPQIEE